MSTAEKAAFAALTKTCSSCGLSVLQPPGSRRTICPGCGNFYNAEIADQVRQVQNGRLRATNSAELRERYSKLHRGKYTRLTNENEKSEQDSGPLRSIANFFSNLGPKKKPADSHKKAAESKERLELPDINPNGSMTGSTSSTNSSRRTSPHLPKQTQQPKTYPERTWTSEQLKHLYKIARDSDDWKELGSFFATTFESYLEINALFKQKNVQEENATITDSGLKLDLISTVYAILMKAPSEIQKAVLKSTINCLLKDKRLNEQTRLWPHHKDDLRAYLVLLLNPLFTNSTTYVVLAHLLRQIASLSDHEHQYIVHWCQELAVDQFKALVHKLSKFITIRLFPTSPTEVPPMSKCHWWIPSCSKVLALLSAANNISNPSIVPYKEFYNESLNNIDLHHEYNAWQNPTQHGGFSFCQYPFMLTISAKRIIMQKDSEYQMILQARKTLVTQVQQKQAPELEKLFLNLSVRRKNLVADSMNEIAQKKYELKKKLKVIFIGEPGLDLGGLTKEWFLLLARELFKPQHGLFVYDKKSGTYWFSLANKVTKLKEFNLVGVLMGLAVYNGINLDISLPLVVYKKLLSPAVVPSHNPNAVVGVLNNPSVADLQTVLPDMASSFTDVLEYDGDVEDLCLTFQASIGQNNQTFTENLKQGGSEIDVTNENKKEYIRLYLDWLLNKSIYAPFRAFYHGFQTVCASNALLILKPVEVEVLVCGSPDLDMSELQKVTTYDGYHPQDDNIKDFWELVISMDSTAQRKFLRFVTGSDRILAGGMSDMTLKITRVNNRKMLPVAHTCFNQLVLPMYNNKKMMRQKLYMAITNTEGFELE